MSQETPPPLRIREEDGSPDAIPVYTIIVSNGTLTQAGPGTVRLATGAGGGTSPVYAATGNQYVTISAAADLTDEYVIRASTGLSLTSGSNILFVHYGSLLVTSSRTINTTYPLSGGANLSADRTLIVDTAFLVTSARTLSAGSGLSGGGDLSADRAFSVNTNVRDKVFGFFAAGTLTTVMLAASARIYAPFNMEVTDVRLAVVTTPVGANIIVQVYQFGTPVAAGSAFYVATNRPIITTGGSVGTGAALANNVLYTGSYLGFSIDQIGTTSTGESMTITVIARTS